MGLLICCCLVSTWDELSRRGCRDGLCSNRESLVLHYPARLDEQRISKERRCLLDFCFRGQVHSEGECTGISWPLCVRLKYPVFVIVGRAAFLSCYPLFYLVCPYSYSFLSQSLSHLVDIFEIMPSSIDSLCLFLTC